MILELKVAEAAFMCAAWLVIGILFGVAVTAHVMQNNRGREGQDDLMVGEPEKAAGSD